MAALNATKMTILRTFLVLALLPSLAMAWPRAKKEIPFIYLNPNQVLYITVIDNIADYGDEYDRFHYIEETLEKVFRETDFPMGYKVGRFGWRPPKDQPELQLIFHKWGHNGIGEIEVRLNASLKTETPRGRNRNKLGYFRHTDGGLVISTSQAVKKYNEVLGQALIKLVRELNNHFDVNFDDPRFTGPADLPPSLGTPVEEE